MCNEREITRNTINSYLERKKNFSFNELKAEIVKKGGILRVFGGTSFGEYIDTLEENGTIRFDPESRQYQVQ